MNIEGKNWKSAIKTAILQDCMVCLQVCIINTVHSYSEVCSYYSQLGMNYCEKIYAERQSIFLSVITDRRHYKRINCDDWELGQNAN